MRHVLIYTLRQNFSLEHIPTSIYVCRNVLIYLKSTALISLLMRSVICRRYKIKISTVANVIKLQELESRGIQAAKCKLTRMHRDIFYNLNLPHICMAGTFICIQTFVESENLRLNRCRWYHSNSAYLPQMFLWL